MAKQFRAVTGRVGTVNDDPKTAPCKCGKCSPRPDKRQAAAPVRATTTPRVSAPVAPPLDHQAVRSELTRLSTKAAERALEILDRVFPRTVAAPPDLGAAIRDARNLDQRADLAEHLRAGQSAMSEAPAEPRTAAAAAPAAPDLTAAINNRRQKEK